MGRSKTRILLSAAAAAVATATTPTTASSQKYIIAGVYETKSVVARTAARIDLDQAEIERLLALDSLDSDDRNNNNGNNDNDDDRLWLGRARAIYEHGMHSGPYARITLDEALDHEPILPKPEEFIAYSNHGTTAHGNNGSNDGSKEDPLYKLHAIGASGDTCETPVTGYVQTRDPSRTFRKGSTTELIVVYGEGSDCMAGNNLERCLVSEGGLVLQGYGALNYHYDPYHDHSFVASLKEFSEEEGLRMLYCETHNKKNNKNKNAVSACGGGSSSYQEYQHFYDFYGILDYGHHWIDAAFAGHGTSYTSNDNDSININNEDFSLASARTRNAAIATATVAMNVFTHVNRLMVEYGIDGCSKHERDFSSYGKARSATNSFLESWDTAVATYAGSALVVEAAGAGGGNKNNDDENDGSSARSSSSSSGSLYYHMVRSLAADFGVLEEDNDNRNPHGGSQDYRSVVNRKVLEEFQNGRTGLFQGDCKGSVTDSYRKIVRLMRIPWIQGVLKAAYVLSNNNNGGSGSNQRAIDEERGRGIAFLAAVLPDLHHCSPAAARTVYDQLRLRNDNDDNNHGIDYEAVRDALEHNYECLGVTCEDVGGYLDPETAAYYRATRPCGGYGALIDRRRSSSELSAGAAHHRGGGRRGPGTSYAAASFGGAVVVFCASLAVLVVAINERARRTGGGPASGIVSAVSSQADYWVSGVLNRRGGSDDTVRGGYNLGGRAAPRGVQLRSMSPPYYNNNNNNNNNDSDGDGLL